jgi:integrase
VASIAKRADGRWRARYRDAHGKEHARHFNRKIDAQNWLDSVTTAVQTGVYVDPNKGKITIGDWAARWLDGQAHLKASTYERYAGIMREHVLPQWSAARLVDVSHADVQAWVTRLVAARSPATVRKVHRVFSLMLKTAVKDGRLARNPAADVNLPRVVAAQRRYLTHEQVHALADAFAKPADVSKHRRLDERENNANRLIVLFLSYTGVRFGELAALRVGRLDLLRRRAIIAESVTVVQRRGQVWGTPKSHEQREVPIPRFLIDDLAEHVRGKSRDDFVFAGVRSGTAMRAAVFRRAGFDKAAEAIGVPGLHPHELRHTAASLAIASGANVKVVQQMLGHKSATVTLDQYSHLFGDDLDTVADRLDAHARTARGLLADYLRTNGELIKLPATGSEVIAQ